MLITGEDFVRSDPATAGERPVVLNEGDDHCFLGPCPDERVEVVVSAIPFDVNDGTRICLGLQKFHGTSVPHGRAPDLPEWSRPRPLWGPSSGAMPRGPLPLLSQDGIASIWDSWAMRVTEPREEIVTVGSRPAEVARLLHRLGWSLIATCLIVGGAESAPVLLGVPASLIAADSLRRLAPLLEPVGERYVSWASIAAGGAAVAALMQWLPGSRDAGSLTFLVVGSMVVSLYAVGLAAWVATVDRGHLARRLRISVVCWWTMLTLGTLAFLTGSPSPEVPQDGAMIVDRAISDWWFFPILGLMIVSYWLLAGPHHVVKTTMSELAAESPTD